MFYKELLSFVLFLLLPMTKAAIPGTFFWRPRFGLDLAIPTTEPTITAYQPNKQNVEAGIVVLIDGYDILTSILGLLSGPMYAANNDLMNPANGIYYNNCYRWALRAMQLFPQWIRGNFHEALGVWYYRFRYMDAQLPDWLKKALPWVSKSSWDKEIYELKKYRKDSEPAFSPFYRFPSKTFHNFNSFLPDTVEEFIFSSVERDEEFVAETTQEIKDREKKIAELLHKAPETTTIATTTIATTTKATTIKNMKKI